MRLTLATGRGSFARGGAETQRCSGRTCGEGGGGIVEALLRLLLLLSLWTSLSCSRKRRLRLTSSNCASLRRERSSCCCSCSVWTFPCCPFRCCTTIVVRGLAAVALARVRAASWLALMSTWSFWCVCCWTLNRSSVASEGCVTSFTVPTLSSRTPCTTCCRCADL